MQELHLEKTPYLLELQADIETLRQEIIQHPLYPQIKDIRDLQIFMKYHVFAVWDFMSLLKTLQRDLTCITVPWYPKGNAYTRFLINEIVVGEESDVDMHGHRISHFELYLQAMKQCGADTSPIEDFLFELLHTHQLEQALQYAQAPEPVQAFVKNTFEVIESNKNHVQAAVFTFGREDLIPDMFISIVQDIHKSFPDELSTFKYYLERHIEVDGGEHSHLALQMTTELCENNPTKWNEAKAAVKTCLRKRKLLWDGALHEILSK